MRHKFKKLLSLVLALILCFSMAQPAYAAYYKGFNWGSWFKPSWNQGQSVQKPSKPNHSTGGAGQSSSGSQDTTMTLVEDESTVSEGTELRASTYSLTSNYATTTTLKYFPVTLYNYTANTINNATHQVEVDNSLSSGTDLTCWNGIYFNDGAPAEASYSYSTDGEVSYTETLVNYSWWGYDDYINNGYYVDVDGTKYLVTDLSCTRNGRYPNYTYSWTITYTGGTANASGSSITLYTASSNTASTGSLVYAPHNVWTNKIFDSTDSGMTNTFGALGLDLDDVNHQVDANNFKPRRAGYVYSGLVQSNLDANKNLIFNYPEGGIFNSDTAVKDIYTNVGLPFDFDGETYTFDAQGNATAKFSGTPASNTNLTKQSSKGNFLPFGSSDWHFGMAATIPFTMTADGKLSSTNQKDIVFNFAGDDDVWVFIDGVLVLDMGGIHNSVSGSLNFAQNTTKVCATTDVNRVTTSSDGSGYLNTTEGAVSGAITGKLFNDNDGTGILNQTLETFAAKDSHELTIFYLERGAGVSNCKIQFNLPMKDTVSVQKLVSDKDNANQDLDAETLAQINNRDFGFTLYKGGDPVANANYNLLNENGQYISTPSTDANGHFTLKNGQTAKFVGEIGTDVSYYVVEDADDAAFWTTPTWTYTANVANGAEGTDSTVTNVRSMTVTATGSSEAEDSIVFTCTNTWVHQDNTSISAVDDKIVIDYGLPVEIDVLANDTVSNGAKSIVGSITGAKYGTATIKDGKIIYQLTEPLTGVEVLTYTAKATASSGVEGDNKTATAKVYIIPATSMYYEENFTGLVTFSDGWRDEGTAQTDPQEPGVVGNVGDSPYGSDAAYRNDSGDSNGSSKYVNTSEGEASFSYTFTGTGTSFFARTGSDSAYMRVVVKDSSGTTVSDTRRNNIYKAVEGTYVGTLYNVPVFTLDELEYGTYTVTVTLMKANANISRGPAFYLDGIRVINPLNPYDANGSVANAAYATDGEANMTVVTLRQKLLGDASINEDGTLSWDGINFAVFTDSNGEITTAEEYKSNGPKEEVYLNNGQSVTFSLYDWDRNTNKIYLGVKAPQGSGTVSINGNPLNINNATDCYYDISNYASITEVDGVRIATFKIESTIGLISVTNIKVTGNAEFTIVEGKNVDASGDENTTEEGE